MVGASVRFLVLITAGVAVIAAVLFGLIVAVVWPLIPLAIIFCIYKGIIG